MAGEELKISENADWFLQTFINIVNGGDLEIGLTLNVGGFLVSGNLISGHKYFEGFAKDFSAIFDGLNDKKEIEESFKKFGDIYIKTEKNNEELPPAKYIHLKDAKFYNTAGNPIPWNRGVWWRGRLSEVSGFMLGTLNVEAS